MQDQVLSSMQQKLDCLCEQLNNKNMELPQIDVFGSEKTKFVDCGCCLCDQHHDMFNRLAVSAHVHLLLHFPLIIEFCECNFLFLVVNLIAG